MVTFPWQRFIEGLGYHTQLVGFLCLCSDPSSYLYVSDICPQTNPTDMAIKNIEGRSSPKRRKTGLFRTFKVFTKQICQMHNKLTCQSAGLNPCQGSLKGRSWAETCWTVRFVELLITIVAPKLISMGRSYSLWFCL